MSIDQLLGAIYQELINDLPPKWVSFEVEAEIVEHDGKAVISNFYRYKAGENEKLAEFTPSNVIIPANAMELIQKKMKVENDGWRKALFEFNADKSVSIDILVK